MASKRTARIDLDAATVFVKDGTNESLFVSDAIKSPDVLRYLVMTGLRHTLLGTADAQATFNELAAGHVPSYRKAAPEARPTKWRRAIALALAQAHAVAAAPKAKKAQVDALAAERLPSMERYVEKLSRDQVVELRKRRDVQEAYRALHGTPEEGDGTASLLELFGLVSPLAQEVDAPPPTSAATASHLASVTARSLPLHTA